MPRVDRTPEAMQDLAHIVAAIAVDNLSAALDWIDLMEDRFITLSTHPGMGERMRFKQAVDVHRHCVGNYVIYYRPQPDGIEVYRVLHGARQQDRLL